MFSLYQTLDSHLLFHAFYETLTFFSSQAKSSQLDFLMATTGQAINCLLFFWQHHHASFEYYLFIKVADHQGLLMTPQIINRYLADLV